MQVCGYLKAYCPDPGTCVVMVLGGLKSQGMYFVILDSLLSADIRAISSARNCDSAAWEVDIG